MSDLTFSQTVMMLAVLGLSACSPRVEITTPPRAQALEFERVLNASSDVSQRYQYVTHSAFAVLWPLNFDTEGKKLLTTVLATADGLQETQGKYTTTSNRLKKESRNYQCECILTGICETEVPPDQQTASAEKCTKLESEQLENDELLAKLVELQETLKDAVLKMGGYWLELSAPLTYDFSNGMIDFHGAEFFNKEQNRIAVDNNAFWTLDSVDVEGALKVQGELKIKHNGRVYRGELGFQLPERGE